MINRECHTSSPNGYRHTKNKIRCKSCNGDGLLDILSYNYQTCPECAGYGTSKDGIKEFLASLDKDLLEEVIKSKEGAE